MTNHKEILGKADQLIRAFDKTLNNYQKFEEENPVDRKNGVGFALIVFPVGEGKLIHKTNILATNVSKDLLKKPFGHVFKNLMTPEKKETKQ